MRVHHQIYAVENWLVIRICSDGKTLVDRSNKFPETSLRPADDPWKAACAYVEETFKLSQRHFEIDEKELVQEGKTVSKYPGLATFARRHVITLRMLTGQSSDTPMPAFDAKYTWSTDTMKETPRHRSLILDDAKLVHGWTNESLLLLLRRHHVNVDILHKEVACRAVEKRQREYHSLLYILPMRVSRVLHVDARQPNCVYRPSRLYSQPLSIMS